MESIEGANEHSDESTVRVTNLNLAPTRLATDEELIAARQGKFLAGLQRKQRRLRDVPAQELEDVNTEV
jgi:hypothetical protein